jgi:prepilin-type N-terminal cleavage/methylation domain-containing protein
MKLKNKKAFTLIDLMIVISIIGILVAVVAIPRFNSMYLTAKWQEINHVKISSTDIIKLKFLGYTNKQILKINVPNMKDILSKIRQNSEDVYMFTSMPNIRPENGNNKVESDYNSIYSSISSNNILNDGNNNNCDCTELYKEIYELRKKLEERR